jgi:hypothetical protein
MSFFMVFYKQLSAFWTNLISNCDPKRKPEKIGDTMNKKTMYLIVAVLVIVIIVAGAAAYILMNNGGGGTNATPTPAPTTAPTVVGASSLQFTVDETTNGANQVIYNFAVKNFNASNEMLRVDIPSANYSLVVKLADSTSFSSVDNGATWIAGDFVTDAGFATTLNNYVTELANWNGHDATYSYTAGQISNVISAIHVNPPLEDSLFATS